MTVANLKGVPRRSEGAKIAKGKLTFSNLRILRPFAGLVPHKPPTCRRDRFSLSFSILWDVNGYMLSVWSPA